MGSLMRFRSRLVGSLGLTAHQVQHGLVLAAYGASAKRIAYLTNMTEEQAGRLIKALNNRFSAVSEKG